MIKGCLTEVLEVVLEQVPEVIVAKVVESILKQLGIQVFG
jgi:hypothetical protein